MVESTSIIQELRFTSSYTAFGVVHVQAAQQNIPIFISISEQDWSPIFVVVQDPCGCRHPKCVRAMIE